VWVYVCMCVCVRCVCVRCVCVGVYVYVYVYARGWEHVVHTIRCSVYCSVLYCILLSDPAADANERH
jgi:hypothetical protein